MSKKQRIFRRNYPSTSFFRVENQHFRTLCPSVCNNPRQSLYVPFIFSTITRCIIRYGHQRLPPGFNFARSKEYNSSDCLSVNLVGEANDFYKKAAAEEKSASCSLSNNHLSGKSHFFVVIIIAPCFPLAALPYKAFTLAMSLMTVIDCIFSGEDK